MGRRPKGAQEVSDIEPLDVDGVRTVSLLTVLWGVAFVVLVIRRTVLEAEGNGWWLWTCLAGVGLGMLGLEYTRRRRDAIEDALLRAEAADDEDDPQPDAVIPPQTQTYDPGVPPSDNVTRPIAPQATGQQPVVVGQQPAVTGQQPPVREQRPHVTGHQPPDTGQRPPVTGQQPVVPERPLPRREPQQAREPQLPRTTPPPAGPDDTAATTGSFPRVDDESREFSAYRPRRARAESQPSPSQEQDSDDDPLLETTLGGGRRARRASTDKKKQPEKSTDEDDPSSPNYRGRRRRRDAS